MSEVMRAGVQVPLRAVGLVAPVIGVPDTAGGSEESRAIGDPKVCAGRGRAAWAGVVHKRVPGMGFAWLMAMRSKPVGVHVFCSRIRPKSRRKRKGCCLFIQLGTMDEKLRHGRI